MSGNFERLIKKGESFFFVSERESCKTVTSVYKSIEENLLSV